MKKNILSILAAVLLTVTLAGCSGGPAVTDPADITEGAKSEWDLLSTPYVMISYFGPDNPMMEPMKELYEESADIEPVTIGDYTWSGFTGKSIDTPIAILWTGEEGSDQIQVMICLENGDKISLEDADVQAIIASINISK